jgi:hypothetical protein
MPAADATSEGTICSALRYSSSRTTGGGNACLQRLQQKQNPNSMHQMQEMNWSENSLRTNAQIAAGIINTFTYDQRQIQTF